MPIHNDASDTQIHRASDADRPVAERLWLMFRHEMSEFTGALPNPDGTFRSERLQSAFTGDPDWAAYLVMSGEAPVGLALVRSLSAPTRVLNSFFIVRAGTSAGDRTPGRSRDRHPASRPMGSRVPGRQHDRRAVLAWRRPATRARFLD